MKQSVFHVLALAHQPVTAATPSCAYTMKVRNLCRMLDRAGHHVDLYGAGDATSAPCSIYHGVVPNPVMAQAYGEAWDEQYNQGYRYGDPAWQAFVRKGSKILAHSLHPEKDNVVLASFGLNHQEMCPGERAAMTVESGIGYTGVFAKRKVWESYAWQHFMYGSVPELAKTQEFDTVIPNAVDPTDFFFSHEKDGYLLYLGRIIPEKGVEKVYLAAQAAGRKLLLAGKGDPDWIRTTFPDAEWQGMVAGRTRSELIARATALICPTRYVEPFGGVAVEAAISGTPVIASDWGAFTETVVNGVTGYRVRDVHQMVASIHRIETIRPETCRRWAMENFSLEAVWPRYESYLQHQLNLWRSAR